MVEKRVYVCEICGRTIYGVPIIMEIAGHRATTCQACAKRIRGEKLKLIEEQRPKQVPARVPKRRPRQEIEEPGEGYELVEDFGQRIRRAREELGLKLEHIAKAINVKTSTLSKIEVGKIIPSYEVARAIEKVLDARIIIKKPSGLMVEKAEFGPAPKVTLGELVSLKEKKKGK